MTPKGKAILIPSDDKAQVPHRPSKQPVKVLSSSSQQNSQRSTITKSSVHKPAATCTTEGAHMIELSSDIGIAYVLPPILRYVSTIFYTQEERFVVQASLGLHEVPRVKDWSIVRKMSLMNNEIQEISSRHECHHLTTLILIIRSCDIWEMEIGRTSWDIILTRKD
ncbi:hypothetical protein HID58_073079 [Brassica napus]|uniref:Uncharacterized protein n=1 Tax=Brassica napus TaxID=3708 RepID=A0ABQ7Z685_BRANA|nr:hypothetical protein HID58_073079 [Brassica napus]